MPRNQNLLPSVLWHPDFNSANLMINSSSGGDRKQVITGLLDWQGTICAPILTQATMPPAFAYDGELVQLSEEGDPPKEPKDFDSLAQAQKDQVKSHLHQALLHQKFQRMMAESETFQLVNTYSLSGRFAQILKYTASSWNAGYTWFRENLLRVQLPVWMMNPDAGPIRTVVPFDDEWKKKKHKARFAVVEARHRAF